MIRQITITALTFILVIALYSLPAQAKSATTISFGTGEYCGSFTGNIMEGRVFRLWLLEGQTFFIENIGRGLIKVDYVKGPSGKLEGKQTNKYQEYYIDKGGRHDILIYGNTAVSSIDFCAL